MINAKQMRQLRRLSFVPRWIVTPTIRRQTVDGHSFGVAANCLWLLDRHYQGSNEVFRCEVLTAAILHDSDESVTGDTPSPNKPKPAPNVVDQVHVVLKCADLLETIQFCREEQVMGNQHGVQASIDWTGAKFHDWWEAFHWNTEHGRKPITSDIIRLFMDFAVSQEHPHPVLEGL